MSYYSQRLAHDSDEVRRSVHDLGLQVGRSLQAAVDALLTRNDELAYETILGDHPINRISEQLDEDCHHFIAKHLPSAGHLRFISSSLRMIVLLERMGDYAATISRNSIQLKTPLSGTFRAEVEAMAADALQMFDRALSAYAEADEELALDTMRFAKQVDRDFQVAFEDLTENVKKLVGASDLIARLVIISQLERVSDQAKNICEETVFAVTGHKKMRRPMRMICVDTSNGDKASLTAAIGNKFFNDRAVFSAVTDKPNQEIENRTDSFMKERGMESDIDLLDFSRWTEKDWANFDIIICLDCSHKTVVQDVPFLTVALDWWLPEQEDEGDDLTDAYRFLRANLEDLVVTVRGEKPLEYDA